MVSLILFTASLISSSYVSTYIENETNIVHLRYKIVMEKVLLYQ